MTAIDYAAEDQFILNVKVHFRLNEDKLPVWRKPTNNKAVAGDLFGTSIKNGKRYGKFKGKDYPAEFIAWVLETGKLPAFALRHVNGNRLDNRPINLAYDYPGGDEGLQKKGKGWTLTLDIDGRKRYLGWFRHKVEAVSFRQRMTAEIYWNATKRNWKVVIDGKSAGYRKYKLDAIRLRNEHRGDNDIRQRLNLIDRLDAGPKVNYDEAFEAWTLEKYDSLGNHFIGLFETEELAFEASVKPVSALVQSAWSGPLDGPEG